MTTKTLHPVFKAGTLKLKAILIKMPVKRKSTKKENKQ